MTFSNALGKLFGGHTTPSLPYMVDQSVYGDNSGERNPYVLLDDFLRKTIQGGTGNVMYLAELAREAGLSICSPINPFRSTISAADLLGDRYISDKLVQDSEWNGFRGGYITAFEGQTLDNEDMGCLRQAADQVPLLQTIL